PIVLSGGMSKSEDILVAELLGADYAYFGTRFIPAEESGAQKEYKDMIIDFSIEDIIYTDAFSGVHANHLIPSITRAGLDPTNLKKKEIIDCSKSKDGEVKAWKDVWGAGQGVGSITEIQTVSEIVEELKEDYYSAIKKVSEKNIPINKDRKSTRLNSSHVSISYAVFCLKRKMMN